MRSLVIILVCISTILHTNAADDIVKIQNIYYKIIDCHAIVICTPENNMKYSGYVKIPENIDFHGHKYIVSKIDDYAFFACKELIRIELPNSIKSIGNRAFAGCNIEAVNIPEAVDSIFDFAFAECSNLKDIQFNKSISYIAASAFYGCTSLPIINGIRYAQNFLVCAVDHTLMEYKISKGTRWIGANAFSDNPNMTNLRIPKSVKVIGDFAFSNCTKLESVILPTSIEYIGNFAFSSCLSLRDINIPKDVKQFGQFVFHGCQYQLE